MKKYLIALCLGLGLTLCFSSCVNLGLVGKGRGPATDKKPEFHISYVWNYNYVRPDYEIYNKTKNRTMDTKGRYNK